MSNSGDKSSAGVLKVMIDHLQRELEPPPQCPLIESTRISEDLALDSLQSFEMVAALEDHYEVTITIDLIQDVQTMGDIANIVARLASGSSPEAAS